MKKKKKWLIIISSVILLVVVAGGIYYWLDYRDRHNYMHPRYASVLGDGRTPVLYSDLFIRDGLVYDKTGEKLYSGRCFVLNSNGKLYAIKSFHKGKKWGYFTEYYANGQRAQQRQYHNGIPHGYWVVNNSDGSEMIIKRYKYGKLEDVTQRGERNTYFGTYEDGKLIRECLILYDENGNPTRKRYANGKLEKSD